MMYQLRLVYYLLRDDFKVVGRGLGLLLEVAIWGAAGYLYGTVIVEAPAIATIFALIVMLIIIVLLMRPVRPAYDPRMETIVDKTEREASAVLFLIMWIGGTVFVFGLIWG